ncbi:MAG: NADP-dependent malic enzyme [Acidobacteria bacterium]|nr:MAG: NADP-dependent malic enzyme [Acidobacteriota bacterium]
MTIRIRDEDALAYHRDPRPGKTSIAPTKPCLTQRDLSLAYTPGVAVPCREIERDPSKAALYTNRANLVAVISNGTAVLGLGDIGPLAGKPVMEGKAVLFKRFAGVDVFDIEVATHDVDEFCRAVELIAPTFGGINLEDIKAPECFEIEQRLEARLDIPVFHDDQHGTAIIATAGLLNALELQDKRVEDVRVVVLGAGAAGVAITRMVEACGVRPDNLLLVDRHGVIRKDRKEGMNPIKRQFARETDRRTLADALDAADVLIGVSGPDIVTDEMVRSMAARPVIFALANPDPEITYDRAHELRPDAIVATGRSDFPNQVNNVLGFPFIFRGALDVRAREINTRMKLAASRALAEMARTDVPDEVLRAYGLDELHFGPDYILPKPLDPRVLLWVAPAVAEAAIASGAARPDDWPGRDAYQRRLEGLLGPARRVMGAVMEKVRRSPARIVLPEGTERRALRAAQRILDERIGEPVLVGPRERIERIADEHEISLDGVEIVDPATHPERSRLAERLYERRQRRGVDPRTAERLIDDPIRFGMMMVAEQMADGLVAGLSRSYPEVVRPALQLIGARPGVHRVTSVIAAIHEDRLWLLLDGAVTIDPSARDIAEMALLGAEAARELFDLQPRVALLSFSNFGSVDHPRARKMAEALELVRQVRPDLPVDGEMHADVALDERVAALYPHSRIRGDANVLIFPDLDAGNIAYKLLTGIAGAESVGPILVGLDRPVNVLAHTASVEEIVRAAAITAIQARKAPRPEASVRG